MIYRLLGIIYILMNKGTVTAGELAERFEVSVRTIYRDVENLNMAGIPIYAKKGKNGGISLTESFVLNKMLISEEEQKEILAALAGLEQVGAKGQGEILRRLGDFFRVDVENWVSIDFSDWSGRRGELFEQIRKAILDRRVMEFDYYGQYGEMSHRTVEPVQLLFKDYTWYVRAFCRVRGEMRLFKVLRMKRVEVSEEVFAIRAERREPADIDLTLMSENKMTNMSESNLPAPEPLKDGQEETISPEPQRALGSDTIVMRIAGKEAWRIYDRFEEEEIRVLASGDFEIRMNCLIDDWVYGLILSFGPSAEVLEPAYVREETCRRLAAMTELYFRK